MTNTLYLDHWPPSLSDLSDGFALIEAQDERVVIVGLNPVDSDQYRLDEKTKEWVQDNSLWGARFKNPSTEVPQSLQLQGEHGASVQFHGPASTPVGSPLHYTEPPPPRTPTAEELGVLARYREHVTTEDFVTNARGYATVRKFARDQVKVETSIALLKKGVVGYKPLDDGLRAKIVVRRDGPGPSSPPQSS